MNQQERALHIKESLPTSNPVERRVAKNFVNLIQKMRRHLKQISNTFEQVSGGDTAAKQTAFFDYLAAETDGDLMLHDLGLFFDAVLPLVNGSRQPKEDLSTIPFTDADVTAYLS